MAKKIDLKTQDFNLDDDLDFDSFNIDDMDGQMNPEVKKPTDIHYQILISR